MHTWHFNMNLHNFFIYTINNDNTYAATQHHRSHDGLTAINYIRKKYISLIVQFCGEYIR